MDKLAFDRFIRLVELDSSLCRFKLEKEDLSKKQATLLSDKADLEQNQKNTQQKAVQLRKELHALDLELRSYEEQEKQKKMRLSNAATPKEYFSLEGEMEALQKKRKELEEPYLNLMRDLEEAQQILEKIEAESPHLLKKLEEAEGQTTERIRYLGTRIEAAEKERESLETRLSEDLKSKDLLKEYKNMLERVPNPAVPIIKDACSACFYAVSKQQLHETKQFQLIKCQDCFRILYPSNVPHETNVNI